MTRLDWGSAFRDYAFGVDRGVLYFGKKEFVAWNGLSSVKEKVFGIDPKPLFFDGFAYNIRRGISEFALDVEAFSYPYFLEEHVLALCDTRIYYANQDAGEPFNFTFRVMTPKGYEIHLVYNVTASFSGMTHNTLTNSVDLEPFSFSFDTVPANSSEGDPAQTQIGSAYISPTSHFVIVSHKVEPVILEGVENYLYGSSYNSPGFPPVEKLFQLFSPLD